MSPTRGTQELLPGRYAGRVLDLDATDQESHVFILLEDQYFQLKTTASASLQKGDLLTFDVDEQGFLTPCEHLASAPSSAGNDALRWRRPGQPQSRMHVLRMRHQILKSIRNFFDQQDFLEVDTPILIQAPSPESQFALFRAESDFLITSPEFQMKRMLVGGFEKIYQITPCFRGQEVGARHNPEFTMLEWYRAYESLDSMASDLKGLILAASLHSPHMKDGILQVGSSSKVNLDQPWQCMTVAACFERYLGIDVLQAETGEDLKALAVSKGLAKSLEGVQDEYEQIFFRLWDSFENQLGHDTPVFVHDWPMPLASLAQQRQDDPRVAERLELYIAGMEVANGFGELTDASEQRHRFEKNLQERALQDMDSVPLDTQFLDSLDEGMPPSAGMALGIDRLVMLMTGSGQIRDVLCFAFDER